MQTLRNELLSAQQREAELKQSAQLSAIKHASKQEIDESESELQAVRTAELSAVLAQTQQSEAVLQDEVSSLRATIDELQLRLKGVQPPGSVDNDDQVRSFSLCWHAIAMTRSRAELLC